MSYRIRIPTKSTTPDEAQLLSGMERLGLWLQEHRAPVVIAVAVVVIAGLIIGGIVWFDQRNRERARDLEREATALYLDRPIEKPEQAEQNLKEAIARYRQVLEQYPRTSSAPLALFHLGNALMDAKDLTGAIDAYQKFLAAYPDNKPLLGLVLQRLAYAQLLKGDVNSAVKSFTLALETPGTLNKDQVLYELGKIEESQSRPEGALARYQELMKSYPNSPFSAEAAVRAKALEVKTTPADSPTQSTPPASPTTPSSPAKK
ncbi:tetratricopeptide repeat protein [Candidatus Nitrospira bockiana]